MNNRLIAIGFLFLLTFVFAVDATTLNDWKTAVGTNDYYIPNCSASINIKHYEAATLDVHLSKDVWNNQNDLNRHVQIYDTMKAKGWSNLQYRILQTGIGVWTGDCTVAT